MVNAETHQEQEPSLNGKDTQPYEKRYRWVMLALMWLSYFTFGIGAFSLGPLVTPIIKDLKISYSQMGIILGAYPLTYVVVGAIAGAVLDRWGIRKSIFVGLIVLCLSQVLRYFATGFAAMFLFAAMFGLGGPMISIGSPKTISLWFRGKERSTAVGIYMTGVWVGQAIILTTMNSVIMPLFEYSWRTVYVCFGLLAFAVALLWWFLARDIKTTEATESIRIDKVFRSLISVRNVQLVIIMGFLSFAIIHGFNDWLPKLLEVSGLSPALAGLAASLPIWVSIPTIVIVPRMIAPHLRGRIIAIFSSVVTIALLMIAISSGASLITALVFYGVFYCCIWPLLVLILMDLPEVGLKYVGSASGMFFSVAELGGFIGPLVVGAIKDLAGGFLPGAVFVAGLSFIRMVTALFVKIKPAHDAKN